MSLSATLIADFSSFITASADATAAMETFTGKAAEVGPQVDKGLQLTTAQARELGGAIHDVALDVISSSQTFIKAYTDEQDAVNRLNTALATTGQKTPEVVQAYADLATQFQETTRYADEAIIDIQATLTTIGKVGPEQMGLALEATTNLARALDIDLAAAADLVSKGISGTGGHLGKLRTLLGDAYKPGMDAAEMLHAINDRVGPAAHNDLQTYNGQMENLKNRMGEVNEGAGEQLVQLLSTLMDLFTSMPKGMQTTIAAIVAIGTGLAPVLVSLSALGSILAGPIGTAVWTGLATAIGAIGLPITLAVAAAVALAAAIYMNWDKIVTYTQDLYNGIKTYLVDRFDAIVASVKAKIDLIVGFWNTAKNLLVGHSIVPDTIDGIGKQFGRLDREMVEPAKIATVEVTDAYNRMLAFTAQAHAILKENSLFTSAGQSERIGYLAERMLAPSGGGGGSVTVNNTFNITGDTDDIVRKVTDSIMRTIRSGTQLSTA